MFQYIMPPCIGFWITSSLDDGKFSEPYSQRRYIELPEEHKFGELHCQPRVKIGRLLCSREASTTTKNRVIYGVVPLKDINDPWITITHLYYCPRFPANLIPEGQLVLLPKGPFPFLNLTDLSDTCHLSPLINNEITNKAGLTTEQPGI